MTMSITTTTTSLDICLQSSSTKSNLFFRSINKKNSQSLSFLRFGRPLFHVACSLHSDTTSSSSSTSVVIDRSLDVKKKAMDILPQLKGTSIFLVGMNNSIKTSLGKLLAETLRYYYFDSDSLVEEAGDRTAGVKSFKEVDEQGFRESETEVLKQLSSMGRLVVCAGNGAVQTSTNLAFLRYGISLWIDVPLNIVVAETQHTSVLGEEEVLGQLVSEFEEMKEGYATADATISLQKVATQFGYDEISDVTTEDMTLEVLKEIEKLTRVKKMMEDAATPF